MRKWFQLKVLLVGMDVEPSFHSGLGCIDNTAVLEPRVAGVSKCKHQQRRNTVHSTPYTHAECSQYHFQHAKSSAYMYSEEIGNKAEKQEGRPSGARGARKD